MLQIDPINELVAKSDGENIIRHGKLVGAFAAEVARTNIKESIYDLDGIATMIEAVRIAGLLHDIAKAEEDNQKAINKKRPLPKNKFRHNEKIWAYLVNHLVFPENILNKKTLKKYILYLVYWHHGIPNEMGNHRVYDIYETISEEDKIKFGKLICHFLGDDYFNEESLERSDKTPFFFEEENDETESLINYLYMFMRGCLLAADRCVSKMTQERRLEIFPENGEVESIRLDLIREDIENLTKSKVESKLIKNPYTGKRADIQNLFSETKDDATFINAAAGFGKTMLGLLWGLGNGKKLIWVCTKNAIAESIYSSILKELSLMSIDSNVSCELFLTGNVKKTNRDNLNSEGFLSDIIVTNIDNFMSPSMGSGNAERLAIMMSSNVVFDEYHEYIESDEDTALFSCVINCLRMRFRLTKSKTLLLSASPYPGFEMLFEDSYNHKAVFYPQKGMHYPAHHNFPYRFNRLNDIPTTENIEGNSIYFFNSKEYVQNFKCKNPDCEIIHSKYEPELLRSKIELILQNYGKNSLAIENKKNIVATNIIQSGVDISLRNVYESVINPSSSQQRLGRAGRFGEGENQIISYNFFKNEKERYQNSESFIMEKLFDSDLTNKWFDCLCELDGKDLTIDEFYKVYNDFFEKNKEKAVRDLKRRYNDSMKRLIKMYPLQLDLQKRKPQEERDPSLSRNSLRTTSNRQFYYICQKKNGDWTFPFTDSIHKNMWQRMKEDSIDFEKNFKDEQSRIRYHIKKMNDDRYNYSQEFDLDGDFLDDLRKKSTNYKTPYLRFDLRYDEILGIIKSKNEKN